jgi:hypothetical protein
MARSVFVGEGRLRSRGPSGPPRSGESGKNGASHFARDLVSKDEAFAEPGPEPAVAKSGENSQACEPWAPSVAWRASEPRVRSVAWRSPEPRVRSVRP